uniref:Tr-type G domain-containing protein n=1 Tax=Bartheletia paradoxa TaxID=669517 RepID=A0A2D0XHZ2_9BASI|nr:hypothetical protein SPAR04046 [Bartheletia paradoxa]
MASSASRSARALLARRPSLPVLSSDSPSRSFSASSSSLNNSDATPRSTFRPLGGIASEAVRRPPGGTGPAPRKWGAPAPSPSMSPTPRARQWGNERDGRRRFDERDKLARERRLLGSGGGGGGDNTEPALARPKPKGPRRVIKIQKDVYIPTIISVSNFAKLLDVKLYRLQNIMKRSGLDNTDYDRILTSDDASLLAMEFGLNPVVNDEAAFDVYPEPPPVDSSTLPLRPPVVTIMGHVDHGKTTLLDTLRSASVAAGEAGGITQHIGAFSVPVKGYDSGAGDGLNATITFLDTPGHAAFTAMRSRGATVTDIIVLVVAADDGVMPQTKEVIELVEREKNVQLVVAINKCDKPGVDVMKIKHSLLASGVQLEEFGGDVPSVNVSGLKGTGLEELEETISTLAEMAELRAAKDSKAEGWVGSTIVSGTTWCRVRQMVDDKGIVVKTAAPGAPVTVTGWQDLPIAGDEMLEASGGLDEAKKAVANRKEAIERKALMKDVEALNVKRQVDKVLEEAEKAAAIARKERLRAGGTVDVEEKEEKEEEFKILKLIVKGDVSGTVEAVVGSLEGIGNKEAGVKIVSSGVGDIKESDVALAEAVGGATIIGFNVKSDTKTRQSAIKAEVPLYLETVIYRLMDEVKKRTAALLPPVIEKHVSGEATVQQMFEIKIKGRNFKPVAGCRVTNGSIQKTGLIRLMRNGEEIYTATETTEKSPCNYFPF